MIISNENYANYGKTYNVEWYLGNGKLQTTSAILTDIRNGYLFFEYQNGGLFIIEQKTIRSLDCVENTNVVCNKQDQNKIKDDLKYYLDTNEENGVVYIPKFVIEKIVYGK